MARMSARNLEKARGYREEALLGRRRAFYRHVRELTKESIANRSLSPLPTGYNMALDPRNEGSPKPRTYSKS